MDRPNSQPEPGTSIVIGQSLWDIKQAAEYMGVSQSWIRRHLSELPYSRQGRLIRFVPEALKRKVADRKSLEPTRRLMPNNRYQRGGVYLRGKRKDTWYGTYRIDTSEGRQPLNLRLGTKWELVTRAAARQKLQDMILEVTNARAVTPKIKSMRYSDLVEK